MGTRSFIITPNPKGDYSGIYCHWDGYPAGVGKVLDEHYISKAKIRKLINLGNISSLAEEVEPTAPHSFDHKQDGVTVAYGRDRGEKNTGKTTAENLRDLVEIAADMWCQFIYLHFNGVWHYLPTHEAMENKPYRLVAEAVLEDA
jgi:hypothetical protein